MRGPTRRLVRVFRECAHERQINVDVRIDESGENVFAGRVDRFIGFDVVDVSLDPRDRFVLAKYVGDVAFVGGNDFCVLD